MVAVVSGNGLGLHNTSAKTLGGDGSAGATGQGRAGDQVYVNSVTGNLIIQSQDESLSAIGSNFSLLRTYNSLGHLDDDNGDNWRIGVQLRLQSQTGTVNSAGSTITKVFGDGAEVLYRYDTSLSQYVSSEGDGAHDTLSYNGGNSRWTWTDGSTRSTETYDASGRLLSSADADGNTINYTYTGNLLTQVTDASGQQTYLDYTGNNLADIWVVSNGVTQTLTRYTYDGSNRLSTVRVDLSPADNSVADGQVYTTTYTYDGTSQRVASITQTDGTSVSFMYEQTSGVYRLKSYSTSPSGSTTVSASTGALVTTEPVASVVNYSINQAAVTPDGWSIDPNFYGSLLGSNIYYGPEIASDGAGNAIAAWTSTIDNAPSLAVRKFDAATRTWGATTVLETTFCSEVQLAVQSDGDAMLVWSEQTNTYPSRTVNFFARHFDHATQAWAPRRLLDSVTGLVNPVSMRVAMRNGHAVVGYQIDTDGNSVWAGWHPQTINVVRYDNGSWSGPQLISTSTKHTEYTSNYLLDIDDSGGALVTWELGHEWEYTGEVVIQPFKNIVSKYWAAGTSAPGPTTTAVANYGSADGPSPYFMEMKMDPNGNAVIIWTGKVSGSGSNIVYGGSSTFFDGATKTWSTSRQSIAEIPYQNPPYLDGQDSLVMDANGDAAFAYLRQGILYVRIYDHVSHTWSSANIVNTSGPAPAGRPGIAIRNGRIRVAWTVSSGSPAVTTNYSREWISGAWGPIETLPPDGNNEAFLSIALDAQGNVQALSSGKAATYHKGNAYTIPAGATWASISQALYGTSAVASQLQAALGDPPLTAGTTLNYLPSVISITTTVPAPVTPYYVVPAGATWSSIARAVYGVSESNATAALQSALGNPTLTVGAHLVVPQTLSYVAASSTQTTFTYTNGTGGASTANANTGVLSTTGSGGGTTNYALNGSSVTTPTQGWEGASLLESDESDGTGREHVAFNANGDGFAAWIFANDIVVRRYDKATNSWGAAVVLDTLGTVTRAPDLAIDAQGNAILAWVQSDGTANSAYASRYDVSTHSWGSAQLLETSSAAVSTGASDLSVAINGSFAAVAWMQSSNVYVARGTSWSAPEAVDANSNTASSPSLAVDSSGNVSVLWQQSDGTAASTYTRRYNAATSTWGNATLLESSGTAITSPRIAFDGTGNGIAVWQQGNDVFARRYDKATDTWAASVTLDSRAAAASGLSLAIDTQGNALAAWVQSDGVAASTYAARYDQASNTWGAATLLESVSSSVSTTASVGVAIQGGYGAVSWLQSNGTVNDLYVARFSNGSWGARALVDTGSGAVNNTAIALDAQGNTAVVWNQVDTTENSTWVNRYNNETAPYYVVQAGDTWASIAQTLYGVNTTAAASALQTALGNPSLVTGLRLKNLPATLSVSTGGGGGTVAPYYTVQSGDTWSSITQTIYGTSDAGAIAALQAAVGNPTLSAGLHLTVPQILNYASSGSTNEPVEYFDYDQAGRLWRTNSGDGVDKVYLYNLGGQATAEIRSQTRDLSSYVTSAAAAYALPNSEQMRTESVYDLKCQLIKQRQPEFTIQSSEDLIAAQPAISVVGTPVPANALYRAVTVIGRTYYLASPAAWENGGGYYQVDPPSASNPYGTYARVAQASYQFSQAKQFYWAAPTLDVVTTFEYWPSSNPSAVSTLTVNPLAQSQVGVNIQGLANGTYGYRISYRRTGASSAFATQTGTFDSGASTVTVTGRSTVAAQTVRPTSSQAMDRWGQVLSVTDASGNVTEYRYNQAGQLTHTILPVGKVIDTRISVEESVGRPLANNYYDLNGNLIRTSTGLDAMEQGTGSATYNAVGQVLTQSGGPSGTVKYVYDNFGNVIQTTDVLNFRTRSIYDKADRLIGTAEELVNSTFMNANPSDTSVNNNANIIIQGYSYDQAGRRITETNGEGEVTKYWYDLQDNLVRRRTPLNHDTVSQYDAHGHKTRETDANGSFSTWNYDSFGRLKTHSDLQNLTDIMLAVGTGGGATTTYEYDNESGLLVHQSSSLGQNLNFTYDAAGHLTSVVDTGVATDSGLVNSSRTSTFGYDAAGRKNRETVVVDGDLHQDTRVGYDEQGRIRSLDDPDYRLTYFYDAGGNRTVINSDYVDHDNHLQHQEALYRYDSAGRVIISEGVRTAGAVPDITISGTQGTIITYDLKGERTSVTTQGTRWMERRFVQNGVFQYSNLYEITPTNGTATEYYAYDGAGRLTTTSKETDSLTIELTTNDVVAGTWGPQTMDTRTFDKASRVLNETHRFVEGTSLSNRSTDTVYDDDGRPTTQTTRKNGTLAAVATFGSAIAFESLGYWIWSDGYDAAGILRRYTVQAYNASGSPTYSTIYTSNYRLGDSYQEISQFAGSSGSGAPQPGNTSRTYNVNGELVKFEDTRDVTRTRYFANDAAGHPLTAIQGQFDGANGRLTVAQAWDAAVGHSSVGGVSNKPKAQHFFFVDGNAIGSFGQLQSGGAFTANFDPNFIPVSDNYPASVPSQVIARAGDTLRTLAATVFGDQNMWYVIAEANGLSDPNAVLTEGTVLTIPNEVVSHSNSASSFKPFDVSQALGDTTPTQPMPPPKKGGCGVLGQVLVIAVAIVATVLTAGAAAPGTASSLGALWSTGLSALGGGLASAAGIGAAVVGGAVGGAAAQGVAIAAGLQDSFDWKGVALSAVGAGVTAGVGTAGVGARAAGALNLSTGSVAGGSTALAVNATAGSVLTQGIGVATGVQHAFNWQDAAISAVSAPTAAWVGGAVAVSTNALTGELASGATGAVIRGAFGGKIDSRSVLVDAFGNALGHSIVEGMSKEAAIVDRLAKRGFKGAFDPADYGNSAIDNLTLEDLSGPSLSSNPSNAVYQPAMALTADEQRNGTIDPVAAMELQREIAREEAGRGYAVSGGMGQEAQWPTGPAILAQYDRWADINAKNGPLAIEVTRGAEEEAGLLSRAAQGAGHAAVDLVTQPFAQLHDLGAIGYDIFDNMFLGDQSNPNYWSNIGRYEQSGEVTTEGRILNLVGAVPVVNVGAMTYQGTTSLLNGDYGGFAEQVGGLGVGFATGGVIGRYGSRSLQSPLTLELQSGATAYSGVPIGLRSPFAADVAAPSFGRFSSASEFGDESFRRYQQFVDEGYDLARAAEARGSLSGLSNTRVGTYVDRYSRDAFNDWLMSEGLGEGAGGSVQMNRWLRDPQGSGSYARPDIRIPGANLILDATVGEKWSTTPQIINFKNFSGGDRITVVRPTQLGGSYSVWPKE